MRKTCIKFTKCINEVSIDIVWSKKEKNIMGTVVRQGRVGPSCALLWAFCICCISDLNHNWDQVPHWSVLYWTKISLMNAEPLLILPVHPKSFLLSSSSFSLYLVLSWDLVFA